MNNPKLLILDEPTKGFDPINRRLMMDIIRELVTNGTTVVLVTHHMEEVESLCSRLILLKDGRSRLYGTLKDIKKQYGTEIIQVCFEGVLTPNKALYTLVPRGPTLVELIPHKQIDVQTIFTSLAVQKGLYVNKFEVKQPSLDDIFVKIYSEIK